MLRQVVDSGIKVFSFDVDGTLVSSEFVDRVWLQGIPEAYAKKEDLRFEQAFEIVKHEYDKIGENNIKWYDINYWLRTFDLGLTREELFKNYESEVKIYEEVEKVLRVLKEEGYELIISSNAATEFIEFQISPLMKFFSHVFSATSDFGEVKKSNDFYARLCEILDVKPQVIVHTGDHHVFDFLNPRKIGMNAYYLDRNRDINSGFVITDLNELLNVFVR